MKSVLIVCEAEKGSGLGHFYRSIALAQILSSDCQISMLSNNSELPKTDFLFFIESRFEDFTDYQNFDLIVLDGYTFSSELIDLFQDIPFVEISDFKEQLYPTKFWMNTSMMSELQGKGLQYSLLRKEILEAARTKSFEEKKLDTIFIAFGGTDEGSNSLKITRALRDIHYFSKIGVLYPSQGKDFNLLNELANSESDIEIKIFSDLSVNELIEGTENYSVALVSSSTIACEMIALRKVVYTCCLYENQQLLHGQLTESKTAISIQISNIISNTESFVNDLIQPKFDQETLFLSQKTLIDGFAEERIRKFIANCFE